MVRFEAPVQVVFSLGWAGTCEVSRSEHKLRRAVCVYVDSDIEPSKVTAPPKRKNLGNGGPQTVTHRAYEYRSLKGIDQ
jgi:hypothetical protein